MEAKQKSFKDYLREDPTLTEKYTPTEFFGQKAAAPTNDDDNIEEAYKNYLMLLDEMENLETSQKKSC